MTDRVSDQVIRLCTSSESVSSLVAEDPALAPGDAWERLYGAHALKAAVKSEQRKSAGGENHEAHPANQPDLERAARCGKWGPTKPSELFLRVCTILDRNGRQTETERNRSTTMRCALSIPNRAALWSARR